MLAQYTRTGCGEVLTACQPACLPALSAIWVPSDAFGAIWAILGSSWRLRRPSWGFLLSCTRFSKCAKQQALHLQVPYFGLSLFSVETTTAQQKKMNRTEDAMPDCLPACLSACLPACLNLIVRVRKRARLRFRSLYVDVRLRCGFPWRLRLGLRFRFRLR